MSNSTKSTVLSQPKPVNVFYVWYSELCRRLNSSPAPVVKPARTKCETVLDFIGDRLKVEEWSPVIKALRQDTSLHVITIRSRLGNCQFLHDIDTEEKARRMKRRYGTLWTAYILKSLLKSLSYSIRNNQVLTCLELDGLPMFSQYLEPLLQALKKNKTIKSLSLTHCPIKDVGCQMVCGYLRFTPNVEVINFSSCLLTSESGEHLAKLIKYQQINRYCESWHNSLRYEEPNIGMMRGIKRITLNGNPEFGDEGLEYILNELDDDLWIKALDFQKCGITENIVDKVLDVVEYNQSLEIIDLRHNEQLIVSSLDKIFTLLKQKQQFGYQPEFKWCNTMLTLPCTSVQDTLSTFSIAANLQKSKSAPLKNNTIVKPSCSMMNRRAKTEHFSRSIVNRPQRKAGTMEEEKQQVVKLNSQLNQEIAKRKAIEKQNNELKKKLEQIQSVTDLQKQLTSKNNMNKIISVLENFRSNQNGITQHGSKEAKSKITINEHKDESEATSKTTEHSNTMNGFHKHYFDNSETNGMTTVVAGSTKNGFRNGAMQNVLKLQNGFTHVSQQASQIFENLLMRNKTFDDYSDEDEDGDLINYYLQGQKKNGSREAKEEYTNSGNGANDQGDSQVSLYNFIEELKNNNSNNSPNVSINFKKQPQKSKLSITEKDGGT